jgi:hypothetical protein
MESHFRVKGGGSRPYALHVWLPGTNLPRDLAAPLLKIVFHEP